LRLLANSVIVSRSEGLDKLQFVYDGTSVPSLSRLEFALTNTGRTPIRQADIVAPPQVRVRNGRILDVRMISAVPNNLAVAPTLDPSQNTVSFAFPLLNPGDTARFSLLISTDRAEVEAAARIAGVDSLEYVATPAGARRSRPETSGNVVLVMGASALVGLLFLVGLHFAGLESAVAKLVRSGSMTIPVFTKPIEYSSWLSQGFPDLSKKLTPVRNLINSMPADVALSEEQRQLIVDRIREVLSDTRGTVGALILFAALGIVGAIYALSNIWLY